MLFSDFKFAVRPYYYDHNAKVSEPQPKEMSVVARYAPEHKEATRRRMIETAGRRFKSDGAQQLEDEVARVNALPATIDQESK